MHYAVVTETFPPEINGVALTVQSLEQGLRSRGHAVSVVRPRQATDAPAVPDTRLVRGLGLPRYPGLKFGVPATRALLRQWRAARPDAVYVATEGPLGWSALRAAAQLGIPAATGFHTRFDTYMRDYGLPALAPVAMRWMRAFHNRAQATLVPTTELQEFLLGQGFDNVVRLPRAVDASLFDPARRDHALRASWDLDDDGLAVVYVGRIAAEKNLELAVRAFRTLQEARPDARFVFVGDGPERARLEREHPDFIFCGMQRDAALAAHFASGDMFVFPSRSETFGNVTLEAMASGVPTIAFRYGAAREHLANGVHGAAVELHDDVGFVTACVRIGCNPMLRTQMRLAARRAVEDLRPDAVAAALDALLQDLALSRRPDAALAPSA
jgi:glycosyltransferase involved in cell wall biosynthesis